mmetsp:Transcript_7521/g.22832  ORF Transcript_7521/g.22832 Transcript_7521/m.22832 type:complete len:686 (+) Transcript_7521:93-2150(+)
MGELHPSAAFAPLIVPARTLRTSNSACTLPLEHKGSIARCRPCRLRAQSDLWWNGRRTRSQERLRTAVVVRQSHFERSSDDGYLEGVLKDFQLAPTNSSGNVVQYKKLHKAIEVCLSRRNIDAALAILEYMQKLLPFVRRSTYVVVAKKLTEFGQLEELERLLLSMWKKEQSPKSRPDERMCALAMNAAFEEKNAGIALRIYGYMKEYNVEAGPMTFSILMKGHGRLNQLSVITQLLKEAREDDIQLDIVAWNSALDALVRCGQVAMAFSLLQEMRDRRVEPNVSSYNTLIKGAGRSGRIELAFDILSMMRRDGFSPNHITKNSLIDSCMRVGLWERACEILNEMVESKLLRKHAIIGYTSVCAGMVKLGKVYEALGLFNDMAVRGIEPDAVAYSAMIISLLEINEVNKARTLFHDALEAYGPQRDIYGSMITGLCKQGNLKHVKEAERLLRDAGCTDVYNAVLDGYVKLGRLDEAERLIRLMKDRHVHLDVATYTVLLDGYGRMRDVENAMRIFQEMCDAKVAPDLVLFNSLITLFVRCGHMGNALQIFDEMAIREGAIAPDLRTYAILISGHMCEGYLENAWDLFDNMLTSGIKPNERMLSAMMRSAMACLRTDSYTLMRILEEMRSIGVATEKLRVYEEDVLNVLRSRDGATNDAVSDFKSSADGDLDEDVSYDAIDKGQIV